MESVPNVSPDLPAPTWRLILSLLGRLPERALSRSFGRIADIRLPPRVRRPVLASFARAVGVDLGEIERPIEEYPTLNAFFVRRLREGSRTWPADPRVMASPVDGIVGGMGRVARGLALQAKGHQYSVAELLADGDEAARYDGGIYLTLYLSPRHYHRIHTPCAGRIPRAVYVPGALYPVNAPAVMHVPRLFTRNERLVTFVDGERGRVAVVAVGAYNVGRISSTFDSTWGGTGKEAWVTNRRSSLAADRAYDPPLPVEIGAEIMAFHLGSTVVLLFEPGVELDASLAPAGEVRVGQPIAT